MLASQHGTELKEEAGAGFIKWAEDRGEGSQDISPPQASDTV